MRLYLSSFRLGNQPRNLVELVGDKKHAAVIVNACDLFSEGERESKVEQEIGALQSLGFNGVELDLRRFSRSGQRHQELYEFLGNCGLVWVRGGNPFILRRAMSASGFDEVIRNLLRHDALVYSGYSAGISVITPSLHGVELVDDPCRVPQGYDPTIIWDCLGVIPYYVAPHYKSDHPESAAVDKTVQHYIDHHMLFKALRDGEAIVMNGERDEIVS